jgi:GNAT superfamily N-acetyltransferase
VAARLSIAVAGRADVAMILDWAADEGWNPGLDDALAFHAADPDGFLLGSIAGEPVAAISVVRYDPSFAFLGLYIVRPAWRGQGHGRTMWRAGIASAGGRTIGLDGVVERQGDYARSGFRLVRRTSRYGGVVERTRSLRSSSTTVPLADVDPAAIVDYDAGIFPARRAAFLERWLRMPGARGLAVVRSGQVVGYGVARPCRTGFKIGPLFADDGQVAEAILDGLAAAAGDAPVFLDVPEPNAAARDLADGLGLRPVFETARMYTGEPPSEPVDRIFGVTTFELG